MDMISRTVPLKERIVAINNFSQKLVNSGHQLKTARDIITNGLKGYIRKVNKCKDMGVPLHRSALQSAQSRRTKKLLARSNWFRNEQEEDCNEVEKEYREARPPTHSGVGRGKNGKQAGAKLITSTVMFVEFSRGGSLQKHMKEVLDRLAPMLGFKVRVTEKGGSSLGTLLSNKNLWRGEPCGRPKCRTCQQPDEKKEPCKAKNIVYESECTLCNEPGSRKLKDREGLRERKEQASLYVGETARSIAERAGEHWEGALGGKEENHMLEHLAAAHRDEQTPSFRFKVVKQCRTALERQVREAVRIEMRGNVLNKKGMFNRCKLTRMVVDTEWDKEVWEAAWQARPEENEDHEDSLRVSGKAKSRQDEQVQSNKRLKREEEGIVWGEENTENDRARIKFLGEKRAEKAKSCQSTIKVHSGLEWMMREVLKECAHRAVELVDLTEGADLWEEWESNSSQLPSQGPGTEDPHQQEGRSRKEERFLWAMLKEIDKEMAREEKKEQAKKARVIATARKKMGADKTQPSVLDKWRVQEARVSVKPNTGTHSEVVSPSLVSKTAALSQVGSEDKIVQVCKVSEVAQAMGGPCHQYGVGAPPQQTNTRARGHISQTILNPSEENNAKPKPAKPERQPEFDHIASHQNPTSLEPTKQAKLASVLQPIKNQVQAEKSMGGPCHQHGGGGAPSTNKYPGMWPY